MKQNHANLRQRALAAVLSLSLTVSLVSGSVISAGAKSTTNPDPVTNDVFVLNDDAKVENWSPIFNITKPGFESGTGLYVSAIPGTNPGEYTRLDTTTVFAPQFYSGDYRYSTNGGASFNAPLAPFKVDESSETYYGDYTFIVFSDYDKGTTGPGGNYMIFSMKVDSEGNSASYNDSYMVRFMKNGSSVGSNQAVVGEQAPIITKAATDGGTLPATTIPGTTTLARQGYTFLGWDSNGDLLGADPNAAAISAATPSYAMNPTLPAQAKNSITNVYAIWKPIMVTLSHKDDFGTTKVGEYYAMNFNFGGAENTNKTVSVKSGTLPAGLNLSGSVYGAGTQALISGYPSAKTDVETQITLEIKDDSNGTTATVDITIPVIVKGDVDAPRPDWNTGLEGKGVSADEAQDGKIYGFYPQTPGSNGETYVSEGRVYEYRYNADPAATADAADWSQWVSLDNELNQVIPTPGEGQTVVSGTPVKAADTVYQCIALTGLPQGRYEIRFKENDTMNASTSVFVTLGIGNSDTSSQPGYTFLYNLMGGAFGEDSTVELQKNGLIAGSTETLTREVPTREGYTFEGWTTGVLNNEQKLVTYLYTEGQAEDITFTLQTYKDTDPSTGSIVLSAMWKQVDENATYNINFNLTGGSKPEDPDKKTAYEQVENAAQGKKKEETVSLTAGLTPERSGYTFKGWSDGNKVYAVDGGKDSIITFGTSDIYLAAVWEKTSDADAKYAVVYNLAGGSKPAESANFDAFWNTAKDLEDKAEVTLTTNSFPVREGYVFDGWLNGDTLYTKDAITAGTVKITIDAADVALVAQWSKGTVYKINFNPGEGTFSDAAKAAIDALNAELTTVTAATNKLIPATIVPTTTSGTFLGWSDGNGKTYVPGKPETLVPVSGEVNLAAVYSGKENKVIYNLAGGTIPADKANDWASHLASADELGDKYTFVITDITPKRTGYVFAGWTDGTVTYRDGAENQKTQIVDGSGVTALSAVWNVDTTYTVHFVLAGGKIRPEDNDAWDTFIRENATNLADKAEVSMPSIKPVRDGFAFLGWSKGSKNETDANLYYNHSDAADATQNKVTIDQSDIVLNAVWGATTEAFGALTYYDWDGTLLGSSIVAKSGTETDLEAIINGFAATKMAEQVDEYGYNADTAKPLTNKLGYKFNNVWLDATTDAFECYMVSTPNYYALEPVNHKTVDDYTAQEKPTIGTIYNALTTNGTMELKAAYEAQANINRGESKHLYTIAVKEYNRVTTTVTAGTGVYTVMYEIQRINRDGYPVARLKEPALKVEIKAAATGAASNYVRIPLDNKDIASGEVAVDKQALFASATLVDADTGANWMLATNTSEKFDVPRWAAERGDDGFVAEGTARYIYDQTVKHLEGSISASMWGRAFTPVAFADMGAVYSTTAAAKNNVLEAVRARINAENNIPLTLDEMRAAIAGN